MRGAVLFAVLIAFPAHAQAPAVNVPAVNAPGRGLQAQPMPAPQLHPGQFLPAVPPPPGSTTAAPLPAPATTPGIAPVPAPIAPVQGAWIVQGTVELHGVDKVMARTTALTARVGETLRFGPLSVVARSCVVRPPDRAPDAAAFLEISEADRPALFRGWMIASQPQLGLVEHPTHDIRLIGCKP